MILVPEIETVVLLVPRTGSGTLRRAILATYPRAMMIYRHMEADGVPAGYDHWRRLGVVRHPVDRLWSLYKFLQLFSGDHDPAYIAAMRESVARPFDDWLLHNETVFTSPYDSAGCGRFWPGYTVRHPLPENRKSQFLYLRPDLGTQVYPYEELRWVAGDLLGLSLDLRPRHNASGGDPPPALSAGAAAYVRRVFAWDFEAASRRVVRPIPF
jgi:hypothetical protein